MERPTETLPYAGRASAEVYAAEQDEVREKAWQALGDLYARRRLIIGVCAFVGVAAVVITLLLPNIYRAETRVLQPEGGDLGLSGILQSVAPGAASLLGGDTGSFTRYLAILDARTMMDTVVDEFDLLTVYEIEPDDEEARSKAIRELRKNVTFEVSLEYDYMGIQVLDKSPERAAAVANFFVDELNRRHVDLSSSSARQNREFIESRVLEAEGDLDSALVELQRFQEENGVLELDVQVEAFLRSVADVQAQKAETEIQYRALERQLGADNPQTQAARSVRDAARAEVNRITNGGESLMPVSLADMPALGRQYALLRQELLIQAEIVEFIRPLYEQARMEERRAMDAVQVLDPAVPPERKAAPRRSILCLSAVVGAFLLVATYVLAQAWLRRNAGYLAARLDAATGASDRAAA